MRSDSPLHHLADTPDQLHLKSRDRELVLFGLAIHATSLPLGKAIIVACLVQLPYGDATSLNVAARRAAFMQALIHRTLRRCFFFRGARCEEQLSAGIHAHVDINPLLRKDNVSCRGRGCLDEASAPSARFPVQNAGFAQPFWAQSSALLLPSTQNHLAVFIVVCQTV